MMEKAMEAVMEAGCWRLARGPGEVVLYWWGWEVEPGAELAAGKGRDDRITLPSPSL